MYVCTGVRYRELYHIDKIIHMSGVTRVGCRRSNCSVVCRERMKMPYMTDQCAQMLKISNEFVRLQVSNEEYLCMKVLLLLSTGEEAHHSTHLSSHSSHPQLFTHTVMGLCELTQWSSSHVVDRDDLDQISRDRIFQFVNC